MKRLLIPVILLFAAMAPAMAQTDETFQFVDENGSVVPDGTTIVATTLVEDEFMGNNIPSGLYVKNTGETTAHVRLIYEVSQIDNGLVQVCFPVTCNSEGAVGSYNTAAGPMMADEERDLQSEWFPEDYGTCKVKYRLELMEQRGIFPRQTYEKVADGPTVSVVFSYDDPAAVTSLVQQHAPSAQRYDLLGRQHKGQRAIVIDRGRKVVRK